MNIKWIQLLVPVALTFIATPVLSQATHHYKSAALNETDTNTYKAGSASADTMALVIPDSLSATLTKGWYKMPGAMPTFIPETLPNSMPTLTPPPIDEKMIIPVNLNHAAADSIKSTDTHKP